MSNLETISAAGLDGDLLDTLSEYGADDDTAAEMMAVIDEHGLKHPLTMKSVSGLQKSKKLSKAGLYGELVKLQAKVDSGGNGESAAPVDTTPEVEITDETENRIKELLALEEEKLRKRLLKREETLRIKASKGEALTLSRAGGDRMPSGVPAEKVERWKELSGIIKSAKEQRQVLVMKMKEAKAEMDLIRPPTKRGPRKKKEE